MSIAAYCILLSMLSGCSAFIKSQINKKFPPVNSIEKKIESVCQNIRVSDTSKVYDASISVSEPVLDTILGKTLAGQTKVIKFKDSRIDSLTLLTASKELEKQTLTLQSNQIVHFNFKRLKYVRYMVSASTSPYFSLDTLFTNPYFNSVRIERIKYRGLGIFTKRKIIYSLINNLITEHLDNINGQVKNYFVVVKPLPGGNKKVSELLEKEEEIIVDKDATIEFPQLTANTAVRINEANLQLLLAVNKPVIDSYFVCTGTTGLTGREKKELFDRLFDTLTSRWNYINKKDFDPIPGEDSMLFAVKIRNGFLADNLNSAFNNLDFQFHSVQPFAMGVPRTDVHINRPDIGCPNWKWCLIHPAVCVACKLTQFLLGRLPAEIKVGSFAGNLDGDGTLGVNLKKLYVNSEFSSILISKQLGFSGNLNYDFNFLSNGIAIILACPIVQFKGSPMIRGTIANPDLAVSIEKRNTDTNCHVRISFDPIRYRINLSPSPVVEAFTNIRNYLTCNMTLLATGFGLGHILGRAFKLENVISAMNALILGRYDADYQIKSISYPLIYTAKTRYVNFKLGSKWEKKSVNAFYK